MIAFRTKSIEVTQEMVDEWLNEYKIEGVKQETLQSEIMELIYIAGVSFISYFTCLNINDSKLKPKQKAKEIGQYIHFLENQGSYFSAYECYAKYGGRNRERILKYADKLVDKLIDNDCIYSTPKFVKKMYKTAGLEDEEVLKRLEEKYAEKGIKAIVKNLLEQ